MSIRINGRTVYSGVVGNVTITNDSVIVDGVDVSGSFGEARQIKIEVDGNVHDLRAERGSVSCKDVTGFVSASGSVMAGSVGGKVDAGGSVNCRDVGGNVDAGGSVNCGKVSGSVDAGGSVRHG